MDIAHRGYKETTTTTAAAATARTKGRHWASVQPQQAQVPLHIPKCRYLLPPCPGKYLPSHILGIYDGNLPSVAYTITGTGML